MSSTGSAEDNEIEISTSVYADAREESTQFRTVQDMQKELASSHVEQRQGKEGGDSEPKTPRDYGTDREEDEDDVETDEELVGGACEKARGRVKRRTEKTEKPKRYQDQKEIEKENSTEEHSLSSVLQVTKMRKRFSAPCQTPAKMLQQVSIPNLCPRITRIPAHVQLATTSYKDN